MDLSKIVLDTCHHVELILKRKVRNKTCKKKSGYSGEFKKVSKNLRTKCSECGTDKLLQVHHKDFNKNNNALYNLICLCYYCHSKYHPHMQGKKPPSWLK